MKLVNPNSGQGLKINLKLKNSFMKEKPKFSFNNENTKTLPRIYSNLAIRIPEFLPLLVLTFP